MGASDETRFLRTKPRQARSEETVAKLLAAAGEIFGEVGVGAATTTEIAKRAEVAVGSMYHFFPSKGEMALALATQYVDELVGALEQVAKEFTGLDDLEPFAHKMIRTAHQVFESHPGYYAALRYSDPSINESPLGELHEAVGQMLTGLFSIAGIESSDGPTGTLVASFIIDIVRLMLEQAPTDAAEIETYLDELTRVIVAYLTAAATDAISET